MKIRCVAILCLLIQLACPYSFAQRISVEDYIYMYKDIAISEMQRSGIPASIKLAQGILESANGNSRLAVQANNHFGIKCHGWSGEEVYHDDDAIGECFRKYANARESFIDHTDFLVTRSRYAFLFELESTDYRGWARGLSRAGYATDPDYPQKLINLIERHNLQRFDEGVRVSDARRRPSPDYIVDAVNIIHNYQIRINNRTEFVVARRGDTYRSISDALDMMPWELLRYNEASANDQLREGQIVYIQPKLRKAERGMDTHLVEHGDNMHAISQKYAIKLSRLYKLNRMEEGSQPGAGEILHLRNRKSR